MYEETNYRKEYTVPGDTMQASVRYAGALEREQFFSLREVRQIVQERLWLIVLVTLICVGAAVGLSLLQAPMYSASAKILVSQKPGGDQQANLAGDVQGLQQLTQTMVEAIDSRPIAEETTRQLGLHATPQALLNRLTVEQIQDTQFIQLYFEDPNPKRAQSVVNTICQVSSERISQEVGANNATAKVWETATLPNAPVSPHPVRNGLVALGLGLMIGLGLVFMLEHLSNSWRSPEEVERILGVPALGIIPAFEAAKSKQRRAKDRMIKSGASTKPRL